MPTVAITHFESQSQHTELKHELLKNTLNSAIGIANNSATKYPNPKYTYVDLFAGRGLFNDGTKGSPIIALETMTNYLKSDKPKNFKELRILAIEQNEYNQNELEHNIQKIQKNDSLANEIKFHSTSGDWQQYSNEIKTFLSYSNSGFIFADPFSTELNLKNLKDLIDGVKYHDVLILINNNALERVLGLNDINSLNKICNYFDVNIDIVRNLKGKNLSNSAIIRNLIKISLCNVSKDYIVNIALPRTREGNIENGDRFYLCLLTSSVGVADNYLSTYSAIKNGKEQAEKNGQPSLFDGYVEYEYFNLCDTVYEMIQKESSISLYEIVSNLYDNFFSWKDANSKEIPTSNNLKTALNILLKQNKIDTLTDNFINQKCKSQKQLTKKAFSSKVNLSKVTLLNR